MDTDLSLITGAVHSPARLQAVHRTKLLDTLPEDAFDSLTSMAAKLIGAPFAFATIVDDRRSFWKSSFGLPQGSPRQNTVEESFCQYVIDSGTRVIVGNAATNPLTRDNPSIKLMAVEAWAGLPIVAPGGEVLGSFCVVDVVPREWTMRDIEILEILAQAASREIDLRNALASERIEKERAHALIETLQESLLPPTLPDVCGLDLAACFVPAGSGVELVGDFYDVFAPRNGTLSFLVGDVCGKGIEAAKLATYARHVVSAAAIQGVRAKQVLERLNTTVIAKQHIYKNRFLTAVYGTITEIDHVYTMVLASGGHLPPVLRRADGSFEKIVTSGDIIGVWSDFQTSETTTVLCSGDTIVIFTDGVNEARDDLEFFGEDRVLEILSRRSQRDKAQLIADCLRDEVVAFSQPTLRDDIAILVIRIP